MTEKLEEALKLLEDVNNCDEPTSKLKLAKFFFENKLYKLSARELRELKGISESIDILVNSTLSLMRESLGDSNHQKKTTQTIAEIKL